MTKTEAFRIILLRFEIAAVTVSVDFDPAGTTYEYAPSDKDLDVVEAMTGIRPKESDLVFSTGAGLQRSRYSLSGEFITKALPRLIAVPSAG